MSVKGWHCHNPPTSLFYLMSSVFDLLLLILCWIFVEFQRQHKTLSANWILSFIYRVRQAPAAAEQTMWWVINTSSLHSNVCVICQGNLFYTRCALLAMWINIGVGCDFQIWTCWAWQIREKVLYMQIFRGSEVSLYCLFVALSASQLKIQGTAEGVMIYSSLKYYISHLKNSWYYGWV